MIEWKFKALCYIQYIFFLFLFYIKISCILFYSSPELVSVCNRKTLLQILNTTRVLKMNACFSIFSTLGFELFWVCEAFKIELLFTQYFENPFIFSDMFVSKQRTSEHNTNMQHAETTKSIFHLTNEQLRVISKFIISAKYEKQKINQLKLNKKIKGWTENLGISIFWRSLRSFIRLESNV